ncbi:MAG: c-type cytochrome [Deltaproteobacteria bacterium]|nr:c-type cytochrome [Deltaproteobacteria bacterium]
MAAGFLLLAALTDSFAQSLPGSWQDPVEGSRVFGAKGCAKCHAVNGVGGRVGPDLGRIMPYRSFHELAAAMWNHIPRMAGRIVQLGIQRPQLNPRETANLIGFLYTLGYFDTPGNLEVGKRLFSEKKCIVCHQIGGAGGVIGPGLDFLKRYSSPIFVAAAMWNHGPAMADEMRARRIVRPTLSGSELLDLVAYLNSVSKATPEGPLYILPGSAQEGRRLFSQRHCIECHSVRGQGGRVGPDLVERGVQRSLIQFATAMWNKAPLMMAAMKSKRIAVPQFRVEEMADIVAYLYTIQYFATPGDLRKGLDLATRKGCVDCHSLSGKGGKTAGDLARIKDLDSIAAVTAALWNHAFIMEKGMEGRKIRLPEFRSDEMAHLIGLLQGLGRTH